MKKALLITVLFFVLRMASQTFPGQRDFLWPDNFTGYPAIPDSLSNEDAVILKEQSFFTNAFVRKRIAVKILNDEGVKKYSSVQLPEHYDLTNYPNMNTMGRFKDRKDPFIYEYRIQYFSARIIRNNKQIIQVPLKHKDSKVYWVKRDGERIYDFLYNMEIAGLEPGDVLEYTYKAFVNWNGTVISIFPNGREPKLNYYLSVTSSVNSALNKIKVVQTFSIDESSVETSTVNNSGDVVTTKIIHLQNLKSVNYPRNSQPGNNYPFVSVNYGSFYVINDPNNSSSVTKLMTFFDPNVWIINIDTVSKASLHDKYHSNIREFLSNIQDNSADTFKTDFTQKLTDNLNSLDFLLAEEVHYKGNSQYAMSSAELINKGRLTEEFVLKNYGDLIKEKNLFYYDGVVIDKRYGEVTVKQRSMSYLESHLYVLPVKKSFKYICPRIKGLKYFLDEIPFYYEGVNCVLLPRNVSVMENKIKAANILLTKTPQSSFNENVRVETGRCVVSTDSLKINLSLKESLSGQFSTLLRHYYNGEYIDSTVSPLYFRKCTDKPALSGAKIIKGSSSQIFPFKHSYNCTASSKFVNKNEINISEWFSFVYKGEQFNKKPNHDFYADFQFTDSYNYLFEFDKAVEVLNPDDFNRKLSNEYFEVTSNLVKQEGSKYLLSVVVKQKQDIIPEKEGGKLMDFIALLDELNHKKINYKIL